MFTGIVEEIGKVKSFVKNSNGAELVVSCNVVLDGIKTGDSISINGVCETVTAYNSDNFTVRISDETLSVTTFNNLKTGQNLNLERALTLNSRLGGHIVSGHIDCKGKLIAKEKLSDFYNLSFEIPENQTKYVVYKGSITVNGISLTVSDIENNIFKVAIIPHTFENTVLQYLTTGDYVNIETDILSKYVEKLLFTQDNVSTGISQEFLKENGFM